MNSLDTYSQAVSPCVSIITVCYRNPAELEQTLAGFTQLDSSLFEVIIVDGSPDDSCAKIAAHFPNFRHLHGPDGGKYDAMNKGLASARGESLLFMNSGDRLDDPTAFAELVRRNREILASTIVYGDCIRVVNGEHIESRAPELSDANLRLGILPSHQSILIPASFHQRNPYDARLHFAADTKLLKAAFRALPRLHVEAVIGVYAYGGVSTSPGSWRVLARQYRELCDAHELRLFERIGVAASLIRRKLFHWVGGEAGLQRSQARRLKRSLAQSV